MKLKFAEENEEGSAFELKLRNMRPMEVRKLFHDLYVKADLVKQQNGRVYDLRTHSLRKYFKTQLLALGVQPDYVDYMMGHKVDTYHDIKSFRNRSAPQCLRLFRFSHKKKNAG